MATTTNYGWETPDDTDLVKDGALAMRTTANAVDSTLGTALNNKLHAGLVLVKTQTIGTGVSSVTVTGAFSSTYDNYLITFSDILGSAIDALRFRVGSTSTGYYGANISVAYNSTVIATVNNNNGASHILGTVTDTSNKTSGLCQVFSPYLSQKTGFDDKGIDPRTGGSSRLASNGYLNDNTSYTSFTLLANSGTITGGTIAVYGYAKD